MFSLPRLKSTRNRVAGCLALVSAMMLPIAANAATEVQRDTSPGGITAWLVSDDTVPLIAMNFAFRGGASQDPADKPGVANLLSALLDEGAGDLDSAAFQRRLEENAVRLSFDAGRDAFSGSLGTLSDRRDTAADLLSLALSKPRFDADPIDRMRNQLLSGLRSKQNDPDTIASRTFQAATYPDHPYGRPTDGTVESMAAITRDEIVDFHARTFAKDNLVVGVVGDITAAELAPLLDRAFGALPEKADLKPVPDVEPKMGLTLEETVPNPQTIIRFGTEGVARKDPDYMAAYIMDHILGGGTFSSRLFNEVREKRGLAYSVWSGLAAYDHSSLYLVGTSTQAARADETVEIIRGEIERMAKDGPTEQELADAKLFLTGNYALRFDTSGKIASQLVGLQLEELPIDYFQTRNDLVEAVTLEDVKRAAQRILGKPVTVLTVGPSSS